MLVQEQMIERVRTLCRDDSRVNAAMMYGSFTRGEGDAFSDIEFLLFFENAAFESVDHRTWLEQIAPVELLFVNEFGVTTAIFDNLIRGEFHFHRVSEMTIAESWRGVITFPTLESTLLVDKTGQLRPYLQPIIGPPLDPGDANGVQFTVNCFLNWTWFGLNVLHRGEYARALELLGAVQRQLLKLARLAEGKTANYLTPSKGLEQDLSPDAYSRFRSCTAVLDNEPLEWAYFQAWTWGGELLDQLGERFGVNVYPELRARISERLKTI